MNTTKLIRLLITKNVVRDECAFSDRNAVDDSNLSAEFFPRIDNDVYTRKMVQQTKSVQTEYQLKNVGTQMALSYPRNATTQYEARNMSDTEIERYFLSEEFQTFLFKTSVRMERVLVENQLLNPFTDHIWKLKSGVTDSQTASNEQTLWTQSSPSECTLPTRLIYQSELCEGKFASSIQFHPHITGLFLAGYTKQLELENRFMPSNANVSRHFVLVWNKMNLCEPVLILESPEDILDVKFNTYQPNLVGATCYSGGILVWDLASYESTIQLQNTEAIDDQKSACCLSPTAATLDILTGISRQVLWVPPFVEFTSKGVNMTSTAQNQHQLYSSYDGYITVWTLQIPNKEDGSTDVKSTCQSLLPKRLKQTYRVFIVIMDKRREVAINCFVMINPKRNNHSSTGIQTIDLMATPLPLFCIAGSDEGEIVMADWKTITDLERGSASHASLCIAYHDGPVLQVVQSPTIPDIVLSIGGKMCAIWRAIELQGPLIEFPARRVHITSSCWSQWQPSIIALGLANGSIEVWDVLASNLKPEREFQLSDTPITSLCFGQDDQGTFIAFANVDGQGAVKLLPYLPEKIKLDISEVRKMEEMIQMETQHRFTMDDILNAKHPTSSKPEEESEFLRPTTDKEYYECFLEREREMVNELEQ